jgi:electron transport complex protein RnfD
MEFKTDTLKSTQTVNSEHVSILMKQVLYALLPGTFAMFWFFGWGVLLNVTLAIIFALGLEAILLKLRQRPIRPFLTDYSAVVTAWLLGLAIPPFSSWWIILLAIFFSIVIAKHLYGGLGYNPFNPAMVGYTVVLISFPVEMTHWVTPISLHAAQVDFTTSLQWVFNSMTSEQWDAVTMATPLDNLKTNLRMDIPVSQSIHGEQYGVIAGKGWEWVSLAYLVGGLWLIYQKVITWHIPVALLGSLLLISGFFWGLDTLIGNGEHYANPLFHLLSGGVMLGAFFIATDPVSASTTPMGKLIYAAGIGFFVYIIRNWGGFPEGVAFAVIIMNMAVPLIDHYTQPKIFGMKGS